MMIYQIGLPAAARVSGAKMPEGDLVIGWIAL
jgi:hypothetical protein